MLTCTAKNKKSVSEARHAHRYYFRPLLVVVTVLCIQVPSKQLYVLLSLVPPFPIVFCHNIVYFGIYASHRRRSLRCDAMYVAYILLLRNIKPEHHSRVQVFSDMAVCHPFSRITHINQYINRSSFWYQDRIFPLQVLVCFAVLR